MGFSGPIRKIFDVFSLQKDGFLQSNDYTNCICAAEI